MRRRALVVIGFFLGCGGTNLSAIMGGMCHYGAGTATILLQDPDGAHPDLGGSVAIGSGTISRCQQSAKLDGSSLQMDCWPESLVRECDAAGICSDQSSGELYYCEGSVTFK